MIAVTSRRQFAGHTMGDGAPSLVERLKNRHVFRVAAMYAAIAWVLLQVGSVVFSPLGLPTWSQTGLIVLLGVGFPIALVFAWIYDVTPEGIVKSVDGAAPTASVAVLPFVAMSDDTSLRHLGDGIAEGVTNQLVGRPGLDVASRTSAFQTREGKDAVAIAHALGVSYVVEGSVRPMGAQLRLTAQLIRAEDGFHVWSQTFDLPANSSHVEQDNTISTISLMVNGYVELDRSLASARRQTANDEAYRHYATALRLRIQIDTGGTTQPAAMRQILEEVDRAIALDPGFVDAYLIRANVYTNRVDDEVGWDVAMREARRSIDAGLAIQPDRLDLLLELAVVQMNELDLTAAQETLERIRSIGPNLLHLDEVFALLAMHRGRVQEAMHYWQRDLERARYEVFPHISYGTLLGLNGDFAGADREFDVAVRLAPNGQNDISVAVLRIWFALNYQGDVEKAKAVFEPVWAKYQYVAPQYFGFALGALGYDAEARALIKQMSSSSRADHYLIFMTYYGLKEYDSALEWLRRAIDNRSPSVFQTVRLPNSFAGLREQPGYVEVLKHLDSLQRSP